MPPKAPFRFSSKSKDKLKYAQNCLALARDGRVDMFIDFILNDRVLFQMKGACESVTADRIKIYLREELSHRVVRDMKVHVYFSLKVEHKSMPCDFFSSLMGLESRDADKLLILAMPDEMTHHQRRFNVRIPVKKEDIGNFKLWCARPPKGSPTTGKNKLEWVLIHQDHVELFDISAGGIQVGISKNSGVFAWLNRQAVLLVSGNFALKNKPSSPLVIAGNIARIDGDEHQDWRILGISYRQWAKVTSDKLQWITMTMEEGVSPLASWVFQAIMERYKNDKDGHSFGGY